MENRPAKPEAFCGECGKGCRVEKIDFGIGPYEFWGQKCTDSDKRWVSNCCEAPTFEDKELTIEIDGSDFEYPPEREDLREKEWFDEPGR